MSFSAIRLVHEGLSVAAKRFPDKDAVVVEGVAHSYAELLDGAQRLAAALRARGLQRGDRVAIYMDNTWACVLSIYAVLMAGGVFLIINPQTKSDKLEFILDDSDAEIFLTDSHLAPSFGPVLATARKLKHVISSGKWPLAIPATHLSPERFDDVLQTGASVEPTATPR